MKIHLSELEIIQGIRKYVESQGICLTNKRMEVLFSTTRKPRTILADVRIDDEIFYLPQENYKDGNDVMVSGPSVTAPVLGNEEGIPVKEETSTNPPDNISLFD